MSEDLEAEEPGRPAIGNADELVSALSEAEEDADRLEDTLEDLTERAAQLLGAKSGSD